MMDTQIPQTQKKCMYVSPLSVSGAMLSQEAHKRMHPAFWR